MEVIKKMCPRQEVNSTPKSTHCNINKILKYFVHLYFAHENELREFIELLN